MNPPKNTTSRKPKTKPKPAKVKNPEPTPFDLDFLASEVANTIRKCKNSDEFIKCLSRWLATTAHSESIAVIGYKFSYADQKPAAVFVVRGDWRIKMLTKTAEAIKNTKEP